MASTTAHIIVIGDEILYGQTLDTNSNFIAKQLASYHINLISVSVIPDIEDIISSTIQNSTAEIIITTGGLGPTKDDKTKGVIAELTGNKLVYFDEALVWVETYYKRVVGRPMNFLNKDQALAPEGSILLQNKTGTAPGIWTEWKDKIIINLPGVPYEMKYLLTHEVLPKLKEKINLDYILHHFIRVYNLPESELSLCLTSLEEQLPPHVKLAYLPTARMVKLRLTVAGADKEKLKNDLQYWKNQVVKLLPVNTIINEDLDTHLAIAKLLHEKNLMLATAESFTSGKIASSITAIPGSSTYFQGGIVAYAPKLKHSLLGVSNDLIHSKGVVNAEVAKQMAQGALKTTNATIAISSTGVAGPNPDEFGVKPGTAFIGIATQNISEVWKFTYENLEREDFTEKLTQIAIQQLFSFLNKL
ncbi:MAG: CinA family nicotinamide mononucleotide deamidase-related protein [Weeksellaceae bacterium]